MKKIIATLLVGIMVMSLVACGEKTEDVNVSDTVAVVEETVDEVVADVEESNQGIEVDKNLFDVEITIPASFFENSESTITQEELDANVEKDEGIKSATLNADGSVTYKITKAKQKEMLDEMSANIESSFQELINDENNSFTDIKANSNYTEFEVMVDAEELGLFDGIYVMAFYMYGGYYNAFAGNNVDDIIVTFKNSNSGDVIQTASYAEYLKSQEENAQ